jgi:hypothetical protein
VQLHPLRQQTPASAAPYRGAVSFNARPTSSESAHVGIYPNRNACPGKRVNPFLKIAGCAAMGDKLYINTSAMGADQRRGNAGPVGQDISRDEDFMQGRVDRANCN